MDPIREAFSKIKKDIEFLKNEVSQLKLQITQQSNNQTHNQTTPTHILPIESLCGQNLNTSIGNNRVPTNRQTDKQTHQQTYNSEFKQINNILESLDDIKKEIRFKFKRLTPQEMLVFNILYTLEEQNNTEITYRILAKQLNLSESSIRDYINKLIKKGIPIEKRRQNNKTIFLEISHDLKNIANLSTIQRLREL